MEDHSKHKNVKLDYILNRCKGHNQQLTLPNYENSQK